MQMSQSEPALANTVDQKLPWYKELNGYHWWVLLMCVLGWMFDTMDQRLFTLGRGDAARELGENIGITDGAILDQIGKTANMWFIYGWATGGIFFGIMGDKWGRAKTMMITILVYAFFTAFSGFAQTPGQFHTFRFLTGLGVGGEFSAGVALLAEVIPERPRPYALGLMQGLSAVGNIVGSIIGLLLSRMGKDWRWLFYMGALPALLVVLIRMTLKEPDSWVEAKANESNEPGKRMGSYKDLFSHRRWRKNAIIGVCISIVGVTGVWGIGFFTPELVTKVHEAEWERNPAAIISVIEARGEEANAETIVAEQKKTLKDNRALMLMFQDIGAFFSMFGFAFLSARIGRRASFMICCAIALASIVLVFGYFNDSSQMWWMGLILGFGTLSLFGGYAVYFPEIFPTRLRSTGVSLCYNVGRYLAGFIQNQFPKQINSVVGRYYQGVTAYRATNIALAMIYLLGIVVMFFAPETKGKPLPTDEDEESLRA